MSWFILNAAQTLYLFAPLLLSAAVAGLVQRYDWLPALRRPIDAGTMLHGERVLGDGKTWRGVAIAVAGSTLGVAVQKHLLADCAESIELVDYAHLNPIAFGAAMGGGAMLGELPNSFVKRRLGIARGASATGWKSALFYVWDQVDVLTCAWPCITPWTRPEPRILTMSFVLALTVHPLLSWLGYLIGARRTAR